MSLAERSAAVKEFILEKDNLNLTFPALLLILDLLSINFYSYA